MEANNKYLQHHGIKGMKWGVRRGRKSSMSDDAKEVAEIKKKKVSEMTNAELKKLNARQELEQKHKQFNPGVIKKATKFVATAAVATTTILTLRSNSKKLIDMGKPVVSNLIDRAKHTPSLIGYLLANR